VRRTADDEAALTAEIVVLATQYGRYGYRRITALLRDAGWVVNRKRVARIWRREGLKVPQKQPKRGRLWLSDGSCIRLRAEHSNHVWDSLIPVHHFRSITVPSGSVTLTGPRHGPVNSGLATLASN
jgi:HTH-like domain